MKVLACAGVVTLLAASGFSVPARAEPAKALENLSDLAAHFERLGLEPLPGQSAMLIEGGVVGVLPGLPVEGDEKRYVLVFAAPPASVAPIGVFATVAKESTEGSWELPPLLADPGRHVIVAYWEGARSARKSVVPLQEVAAYLDLSGLVGEDGSRLLIQSTGSSPSWMRLIEQANVPLGLDLEIEETMGMGSSRTAGFYARGIPGLQLVTGSRRSPTEPESGFVPSSAFAALIAAKVSRLEEPPAFEWYEGESDENGVTVARPYTGTVPDYTADVEGMRLSGVAEGGPADAAGLREGDIIVELAGAAIEDFHGYANALDTLEIGKPVSVVFIRAGERVETTLTPGGRE